MLITEKLYVFPDLDFLVAIFNRYDYVFQLIMVESEKPKAKTEKHLPWIEKYRPVEFNQIVGKSDFLFSI